MAILGDEKGGHMKKEENRVDFDLSTLSLKELIEVYQNITGFLEELESKKQESIEKENEDES